MVQNIPIPTIEPLEVLVQLSVTGLCHTDLVLAQGLVGACRSVLGHEGVGRIVALGSAVSSYSSVTLNSRVGVGWLHDTCGSCSICLRESGRRHCLAQRNHGRHVDGTFAGYVVVNAAFVQPLPEGPPDEFLAPILCGGLTVYTALKRCGARAGQWIVLLGAGGGLGTLGIQYAKAMGLLVIAVDGGKEKGAVATKLGADVYVDFTEGDVVAKVREASGGDGASAALVLAGSGRAYNEAIEMLGAFSTLVAVGIPKPGESLEVHPLKLIDLGIQVTGSLTGSLTDLNEAVAFVERGIVKPLVEVRSLEQLPLIAKEMEEGKVGNPKAEEEMTVIP